MKSYVVIGLGRFGAELATRLYACGEEVMAIDMDEGLIDKIADRVTRAVAADARDPDVLKKLGVENFDRAVVAVGSDLAASALITMNLKSLNVPFIMCKAHDDTYKDILVKLGADRVIIPEREVADKLALGLTHAGVMEYIELSQEFGIVEMEPIPEWVPSPQSRIPGTVQCTP
jgi:trk system potassium uptake protein TrkA